MWYLDVFVIYLIVCFARGTEFVFCGLGFGYCCFHNLYLYVSLFYCAWVLLLWFVMICICDVWVVLFDWFAVTDLFVFDYMLLWIGFGLLLMVNVCRIFRVLNVIVGLDCMFSVDLEWLVVL